MDPFINRIHQVHLVAFVKTNLLELGYIREITTIWINSLQTMGDKSS